MRLVFIVEGDTEVILVNQLIIPYLLEKGFNMSMNAQTIITNRRQHCKGGVPNYAKFKNEIERTLQQGNVIITTLIDFFRLPPSFPCHTTDSTKINQIEEGILVDFDNNPNVIPYIQRHELESLMFSSLQGFKLVIDEDKAIKKIQEILDKYPNPEDINNIASPSKRLEEIYHYDKTGDGELIFLELGIEVVLEKCLRFSEWIEILCNRLDEIFNRKK